MPRKKKTRKHSWEDISSDSVDEQKLAPLSDDSSNSKEFANELDKDSDSSSFEVDKMLDK